MLSPRNVYHGSNGSNEVFSFLPTSGTIASFSGDLKTFLTVRIPQTPLTCNAILMLSSISPPTKASHLLNTLLRLKVAQSQLLEDQSRSLRTTFSF